MQHRFGSSLNLNTHLHAVFPDGVFYLPQAKTENLGSFALSEPLFQDFAHQNCALELLFAHG
jgi:hypothetical protein